MCGASLCVRVLRIVDTGLSGGVCSWRLRDSFHCNGVEAFLYCQLEGAVGDETVTLARQQSTDIFFLVR